MLGTRRAPQGTALLAGTALRATRMEQRVPNPSSAGKKKTSVFLQRQVGRVPKITGSSFPRHKGAVAKQDVNCTVQQRGRTAQLLSNLVQFNHQ